jgi:hypothetical protein
MIFDPAVLTEAPVLRVVTFWPGLRPQRPSGSRLSQAPEILLGPNFGLTASDEAARRRGESALGFMPYAGCGVAHYEA